MKSRDRLRFPAALVLLGIVGVLGLTVATITGWLRAGLRDQILRREGESLYAVTVMQHALERERLGGLELANADESLTILALQTSRLKGVLGVQVFDLTGQALEGLLAPLPIAAPSKTEWQKLQRLVPVVQFKSAASLEGFDAPDPSLATRVPLLQITVPLHPPELTELEGAARFVLEGQPIAREFALLDQRLLWQAGLVWLLASGVSLAGVGWVLRRLARAHRELELRTDDLLRANRELSLVAKTSALGAVTAHLMHGLRNPLAGLESFLQGRGDEESPILAGAWSEANATTRRMRDMINEVVSLLQEQQSGVSFEMTGREVLEVVAARVAPVAKACPARVLIEEQGAGVVTNQQAGLVAAILSNLAQNACEALRADENAQVILSARPAAQGGIEFGVRDNGAGLPPELVGSLFEPRVSTKPGGAGIGLAISRQLAIHLGGTLEVVTTGASGTSFRLLIPPSS